MASDKLKKISASSWQPRSKKFDKSRQLPPPYWSPGQDGYAVPGGLGGQWLARGGDGRKPDSKKADEELSKAMEPWKAGGPAR